jgi:phage shock protein PspC (stress-responsive transcriptional regulator)
MVEAVGLAEALTMTTQATAPIPEPPVVRRFTRSSDDRVIAGVAGGIGRYFGIDPVLVRIIVLVLVFAGGTGLVAYGAAWLFVPSDTAETERFDGKAIAKRSALAFGVLALTFVAAFAGAWGVAIGGGTVTAVVIIAAGLALVVGAFTGGMRWLIVPALALALSAGAVAASDIDARGGVGERIYQPASTGELRANYKLGVGHLRLDLRDTKFAAGEHRVHLKVGVGQAEVLVPAGLCVSSTAHISAGETEVFDRNPGGIDHDWEDIRTAPAGKAHLTVDADIGVGQLRIETTEQGRSAVGEECRGG